MSTSTIRRFRAFKGQGALPLPNPSVIPEFFGDTMLCNGTVYPLLTVEAKRYRFFILNACNARFLNINTFKANPLNADGIDLNKKTLFPINSVGPNIIQIGTEGGYLARGDTYLAQAFQSRHTHRQPAARAGGTCGRHRRFHRTGWPGNHSL